MQPDAVGVEQSGEEGQQPTQTTALASAVTRTLGLDSNEAAKLGAATLARTGKFGA